MIDNGVEVVDYHYVHRRREEGSGRRMKAQVQKSVNMHRAAKEFAYLIA